MELRFVPSESTFAYFEALKGYLQHHGKPVAFYSDKHSIFRVSREDAASGDGMTQFGRALSELNIEILCANTSQAKGRVERAHQTLQDRLVKDCGWQGSAALRRRTHFCRRSCRLQWAFRQAAGERAGPASGGRGHQISTNPVLARTALGLAPAGGQLQPNETDA